MVVVSMQRSYSLPSHAAFASRMPGSLVQAVTLFARYLGGGRDADAPAIDGAFTTLGGWDRALPGAERQDFTDNFDDHPEQGCHAFHRTQHQRPIARPFVIAKTNPHIAAPRAPLASSAGKTPERIEP